MQKGRPEKAAPFLFKPYARLRRALNDSDQFGEARRRRAYCSISHFAANRYHALDGEPRLRCDSRIDFDLVFHSLQ